MNRFIKRASIAGFLTLLYLLLFGGQAAFASELENLPEHWIWPTDGIVTDTYGTRHGHHHGIDIAGDFGSPIYAVDAGVVTKSYYSRSYGHVVFIKHENNFETVYAHLSARHVTEGDIVDQGDVIGQMGSTGRSSGVHLHFEVHHDSWTYNKENSLDPSHVFGAVHIGETIQVAKEEAEESFGLLDQVAMASSYEDVKYLLYSDYELLLEETADNDAVAVNNDVESTVDEPFDKVEDIAYVVQAGDTLWNIANAFETTVDAIMVQNRLRSETIQPGQQLTINKNLLNGYIVRPGDTLTSIAKAMKISVEKIKQLNQLQSDLIFPDQILILDD